MHARLAYLIALKERWGHHERVPDFTAAGAMEAAGMARLFRIVGTARKRPASCNIGV